MTYAIYEASPKAKAKIEDYSDLIGTAATDHHRKKYPFDELKIGQCFTVAINECKEASLRVSATNHGKRTNKKFIVISHSEHGVIECARIA